MFSLSFLNSGILIAATSAIIPIIIYFFAKKRPDKVIFSSLKFIIKSKNEKNSKINLKNILLLIIRILILLLVSLAIARPTLKSLGMVTSNSHAPTTISIIADNSYSMNYYSNELSRLDQMKQIAKEINNKITNKDYVRIYTKDSYITSQKFFKGAIADTLINNIPLTYINQPIDSLIAQAVKDFEESPTANNELYILSDFNEQISYADSTNTPIYAVNVDDNESWDNLSATIISTHIANNSNKRYLNVDYLINNHSTKDVKDRMIRLFLNGRSYDKFITVEALKSFTGNFSILLDKSGFQNGYLEVQDENLTTDNRSFFSFYFNLNPKTVVISDKNGVSTPLKTMVEIFTGDPSNITYTSSDNINQKIIEDKELVIFYKLNKLDKNIETILNTLEEEKRGYILIPDVNAEKSLNKFLEDKFNITITTGEPIKVIPNKVNSFDPIIKELNHKALKSMAFGEVIPAKASSEKYLLLSKDNQPLIARKDNSFLLLFDSNNDFVVDSSYPVFLNKLFENISNSHIAITSNSVNNTIKLTKNSLINNSKVVGTNYTISQPGTIKITSSNGKISYEAANLSKEIRVDSSINEFELNHVIVDASTSWRTKLFGSSGSFELLKYLLLTVLVLFLLELIIVKLGEK